LKTKTPRAARWLSAPAPTSRQFRDPFGRGRMDGSMLRADTVSAILSYNTLISLNNYIKPSFYHRACPLRNPDQLRRRERYHPSSSPKRRIASPEILNKFPPMTEAQHNGFSEDQSGGSLQCGISVQPMSAWGQNRPDQLPRLCLLSPSAADMATARARHVHAPAATRC
jgi:hypothetical protein